jgi:hypothetical protein
MTARTVHARRAAAVRWGRPEAAELGRELAVERAAAALRYLRERGGPNHRQRARLRRLLDGQPFPGE